MHAEATQPWNAGIPSKPPHGRKARLSHAAHSMNAAPSSLAAPLLAIETSASACSAALWNGSPAGRPPAHEIMATSHGHATALAPMIERLSKTAGVALTSLKGIAVSCGPGAFTGIRVGLATARAMALA